MKEPAVVHLSLTFKGYRNCQITLLHNEECSIVEPNLLILRRISAIFFMNQAELLKTRFCGKVVISSKSCGHNTSRHAERKARLDCERRRIPSYRGRFVRATFVVTLYSPREIECFVLASRVEFDVETNFSDYKKL